MREAEYGDKYLDFGSRVHDESSEDIDNIVKMLHHFLLVLFEQGDDPLDQTAVQNSDLFAVFYRLDHNFGLLARVRPQLLRQFVDPLQVHAVGAIFEGFQDVRQERAHVLAPPKKKHGQLHRSLAIGLSVVVVAVDDVLECHLHEFLELVGGESLLGEAGEVGETGFAGGGFLFPESVDTALDVGVELLSGAWGTSGMEMDMFKLFQISLIYETC